MAPAKKTASPKAPARSTAPVLSARLLELSAESNDPEPYQVTEDIVVQPLTRTRMKELAAAEGKKYFANLYLVRQATAASQESPEKPGDDATEEELEAYKAAVEEWENAFDIAGAQRQAAVADEEYERAFFGDAYDSVMEFFEDKPLLWNKFLPDIQAQFLPKVPDAGGDSAEEKAGKAPESLT